jgi:hypothetical protein
MNAMSFIIGMMHTNDIDGLGYLHIIIYEYNQQVLLFIRHNKASHLARFLLRFVYWRLYSSLPCTLPASLCLLKIVFFAIAGAIIRIWAFTDVAKSRTQLSKRRRGEGRIDERRREIDGDRALPFDIVELTALTWRDDIVFSRGPGDIVVEWQ